MSVKSVQIDQETLIGVDETEMKITCLAIGGPPLPQISWMFPENIDEVDIHSITEYVNIYQKD